MDQTSKQATSHTQVLSGFAQVLTAIGFVVIIIGAVVLIIALIEEISHLGGLEEEEKRFEYLEVIASGSTMLYGFMLAALGQALSCIRSLTINVAKLVEQGGR